MPTISFTRNIQRHVACPDATVSGTTVADALAEYFALHGKARGYVLDETGAVRHHMAVFVNGVHIRDRNALSDAIGPDDEICVMQALSGG
jgi:sulfur carrier protein ThiS